jgi:hypothetical protein
MARKAGSSKIKSVGKKTKKVVKQPKFFVLEDTGFKPIVSIEGLEEDTYALPPAVIKKQKHKNFNFNIGSFASFADKTSEQFNNFAKKEIALFQNSEYLIELKPIKLMQGVAVLVLFFVFAGFIIPHKKIDNNLTVRPQEARQNSVAMSGQIATYSILINKSDITDRSYLVMLPENAKNIKITTITQQQANAFLNQNVRTELPQPQKIQLAKSNQPKLIYLASIIDSAKQYFLEDIPNGIGLIGDLINPNIQTVDGALAVNLADKISNSKTSDLVKVDYQLPALNIIEQTTSTGKLITVSLKGEVTQKTPVEVLVFTVIPKIFKVGQENNIHIKDQNNKNLDIGFHAEDTDNDGYLDYVEWKFPYLHRENFQVVLVPNNLNY